MLLALLPLYSSLALFPAALQISFNSEGPQVPAPPAAQTSSDQNCTLAGRVSNSLTGEPLKKATVQLMPRGGPPAIVSSRMNSTAASVAPQVYSAISQADGSFTFANLKSGDYVLSGRRTGYLDTQYGAKRFSFPGTPITLKPGQQKTDLIFALIPQAVITGKVIDDDGDPLDGVMVQAIRQQWTQGRMQDMPQASTQTNDLGEYRLAGVRPGKFYLSAQKMEFGQMDGIAVVDFGKPEPRPVRTFYPEAISHDSAAPIQVQPGQDLSGINIRMRAALTYHVRGKVVGIPAESERQHHIISVQSPGDSFAFSNRNQVMLAKGHTFDIAGVVPGAYELVLLAMGGKPRSAGRQEIEVGNGDLNDVVLSVQPPASLRGRAQLEGDVSGKSAPANLSSIHIALSPADSMMMFGPPAAGTPDSDGNFTLENVSPGRYLLHVNAPVGTYLQSVKYGARETRGKYLDLNPGSAGELDIVFRYGAAEVKGTIQDAQSATNSGKATVSASVVLVPPELNEDGSGLEFNTTDGSGAFAFATVPAGRYKAYAIEDANYPDVQNPAVLKELESKGTDVEVKENESKQLQLPLISASDFEQVLTKLGLDLSQ